MFEDGSDHPLAVLTEELVAAELTLIDQDFVVPMMDASRPPILEIRVGLAYSGSTLSINHIPAVALASAVRFRWLPAENGIGAAGPPATH